MEAKNLTVLFETTTRLRHNLPAMTLIILSMFCSIDVHPAFAAGIRVPLPVWIVLEAVFEFWGFLGFIAFAPLKKIVLGAVLTLGGAFLPDLPVPGKPKPETGSVDVNVSKVAKVNFKGAPRYAVLTVGISIVISSLWDGVSAEASD